MTRRAALSLAAVTLCACGGGSGSSSGSIVPLPATVTNLGLFATEIEGGASLWMTSVREDLQDADLNADGDQDDALLYVYDSATKELHATNLEGGTNAVVANEHFAAFLASEKDGDLDGDGDLMDDVLHIYDPVSEAVVNLGVAVVDPDRFREALAIEGELLAARVSEAAQGADRNGDGDQLDQVVEVFRPGTGERWNTALAASDADLQIHAGLVVLSIDEEAQDADFTQDGDQNDLVTAFFDPATGALQNTGLVRVFGVLPAGELLALSVAETNGDLNGNGDPWDFVPFIYDPTTREARPTPFFANIYAAGDGRFALQVPETDTDLNGDGDRSDLVVFLYVPRAGLLVSTGLAANGFYTFACFVGEQLTFFCSEVEQAEDLNGDGDRMDSVLHVVDGAGNVRNTRVAGEGYDVHEDVLLLSRDEGADGRDWNADGDQLDSVLFTFDPLTSELFGLDIASFELIVGRGERAFVRVWEFNARADLNRDGDRDDTIFLIQNLVTGQRLNTGISQPDIWDARATADGSFLFSAWELQEAQDLNGDGDLDDYWLFVAE